MTEIAISPKFLTLLRSITDLKSRTRFGYHRNT